MVSRGGGSFSPAAGFDALCPDRAPGLSGLYGYPLVDSVRCRSIRHDRAREFSVFPITCGYSPIRGVVRLDGVQKHVGILRVSHAVQNVLGILFAVILTIARCGAASAIRR
jgi:hypothetical protein